MFHSYAVNLRSKSPYEDQFRIIVSVDRMDWLKVPAHSAGL